MADNKHATIATYWKIAGILTVLTAMEVAYPFVTKGIDFLTPFFMPILAVMALLKFGLVCGYFMHLKFDPPILTRILLFSILIALVVIFALIFLYHVDVSDFAAGRYLR